MSTLITRALTELGIEGWVLRGNPTNKQEFATMYAKVTGADANGMAIESTKESDWGVTWEDVKAKADELEAAEPMRLLREERNRRLQETDWRFRSDLTPSQEWIDYCQALRDLPSTASPELDENGQLINVTWPTKPE